MDQANEQVAAGAMSMGERARRHATNCISRGSAMRLHHAWRFLEVANGGTHSGEVLAEASRVLGVTLNQFVTINYGNTASGIDRFDELRRDRFLPWLRRHAATLGRQVAPTYVWVRENVNSLHVHWAVHIPIELVAEFLHLLPRWISSLDERVEGRKGRSASYPPASLAVVKVKPVINSTGLRHYFLKGIDPKWQAQYGVRAVSQGVVHKRRSGYSRNLCPSARRKAGYKAGPVPSRVSPWHRKQRLARFGHLVRPTSASATRASLPPAAKAGDPACKLGANLTAPT